jgi:ubiquinol-cytochrome c reductase cytochrome b subunit
MFRRHGLTVREPKRAPDSYFWPEQVLRDAVACLAVAIVVLVLVVWSYPQLEAGAPAASQLGAELGAPANPAESFGAARPEIYFLFLFQTLKYLEVFPPIFGAIVVPGLVMLSLFLMPFVGRWQLGHRFNVVWTFALLVGASVLTGLAWYDDHYSGTPESQHYLAAVANAKIEAERIVELANSPTGIPPTGALALLQNDPKTQGPKLFRQQCASCHSHAPKNPSANDPQVIVAEKPSASNLWGFGTRNWARGILDAKQIAGPNYFGNTAFKDGDMVTWVQDNIAKQLSELKGAELAKFKSQIDDVTLALATEAGHSIGTVADLDKHVAAGREVIIKEFACIECHKFRGDGEIGNAPDLTGYASRDWLTAFISNPADKRFYGEKNDRMPAFALHPNDPTANRLSPQELSILVSWLRGEWYEPAGAMNPPVSK